MTRSGATNAWNQSTRIRGGAALALRTVTGSAAPEAARFFGLGDDTIVVLLITEGLEANPLPELRTVRGTMQLTRSKSVTAGSGNRSRAATCCTRSGHTRRVTASVQERECFPMVCGTRLRAGEVVIERRLACSNRAEGGAPVDAPPRRRRLLPQA